MRTGTVLFAANCSPSCASRNGRILPRAASLSRTGSCICGVSSGPTRNAEHCVSPPTTHPAYEVSRITRSSRPLYRRCEAPPRSEPARSAMMDDQQAVIAFLSEPSSYGPGMERVEIIVTHVSLVFLAGDRAYKLKRAVKYPYLDFSTAEHRRQACEAELALNRRTAPALYLEVRALIRLPNGRIGFADNGPAIDWVVVIARDPVASSRSAVSA